MAVPDLPRFMFWAPLCGEEFRYRIEPEHGGDRMIAIDSNHLQENGSRRTPGGAEPPIHHR